MRLEGILLSWVLRDHFSAIHTETQTMSEATQTFEHISSDEGVLFTLATWLGRQIWCGFFGSISKSVLISKSWPSTLMLVCSTWPRSAMLEQFLSILQCFCFELLCAIWALCGQKQELAAPVRLEAIHCH